MCVLKKLLIFLAAMAVIFTTYRLVGEITFDRSHETSFWTLIDEKIPFVPETVIFYWSIYLFWLPPILSKVVPVKEFLRIVAAVSIALLIGFLLHVVMPSAYPRPAISDTDAERSWALYLLDSLYKMDLPNNTFLSSHVLTVIVLLMMMEPRSDRWPYRLYVLWGIAIIASTLLVKQHYVIDVAAAILLALGIKRFIFKKLWPTSDVQ